MDKDLKKAIADFCATGEMDKTIISAFNKSYGSIAPYKMMLAIAEEVASKNEVKKPKK